MKKMLCIFSICSFMFLCGCDQKLMNTPTKKVEMFLEKYQSLDNDVTAQLDEVIDGEDLFTTDQKAEYREIMKNHYKNLKYEIKDEVINGDTATVTAEVEVTDYSKVMSASNTYLEAHKDEFNDDTGNYSEALFTRYRLDKLKEAKDTVKYTIDFNLTKENDEWKLDELTEEQESKINGMYTY